MSNALRRAEGLDEDPHDIIGSHHFASVVKCHRAFVRDVHAHALATTGNLNRYRPAIEQHFQETESVIRLHLLMWHGDDGLPN